VHAERHSLPLALHQQMEMRAHQTPRVQPPVEPRGDAPQHHAKPVAVELIEEDEAAGNTACCDVEDAVLRELRSSQAWHEIDRTDGRLGATGPPREKSHFCYRDCPLDMSGRVGRS